MPVTGEIKHDSMYKINQNCSINCRKKLGEEAGIIWKPNCAYFARGRNSIFAGGEGARRWSFSLAGRNTNIANSINSIQFNSINSIQFNAIQIQFNRKNAEWSFLDFSKKYSRGKYWRKSGMEFFGLFWKMFQGEIFNNYLGCQKMLWRCSLSAVVILVVLFVVDTIAIFVIFLWFVPVVKRLFIDLPAFPGFSVLCSLFFKKFGRNPQKKIRN